ncbi:MAG: succinate dehydrogenase [Bdellovibrionaceae bacterium]|nr:succinate dehydrogenase [Pseudobdellovibrionaceae bacterium]
MTLKLKIWRQAHKDAPGKMEDYTVTDVSSDMSFLEMLDLLNEQLVHENVRPVEFDSDCREGICGACGCVVNGQAHGPERGTTVCQLHMRKFKDGDTIVIEPWRAKAFPVIKDLVVDRDAFERIQQAGGYITTRTGPKPDGNAIPIGKEVADQAMDSAACIGCGACVAACPNASASLFTAAKIRQFGLLPQGQPERASRVSKMVLQMDKEGFGNCTNIGECAAACPKEIDLENIRFMKSDLRNVLFGLQK